MEEIPIVVLEKAKKENSQSVGEYVYKTLKKNIINLNIKPGDRISEKEIADMLELSRTPVREAFIKLSQEGVLYILPQRGTYISKIDLDQVEEARFIRGSLEKSVMEIAVQGLDENYIKDLEKSLKLQRKYIDNKQYEAFLDEDEAFHKLIFKACNKSRSWEVIEQVNTQYKRVRLLSFELYHNLETVFDQHVAIYESIVSKDFKSAEQVVGKHVEKILTDQIELQKRYPEYFKTKDD
ncbi:GntR family transcriptional regulator [Alkalibacter mobilis]|uniref:GntR family transcriptional regulator n=1 Tax=Alkalibacter mobilis TaxID=2787712 RepID=UPI0018A0C22F|nr:GntR family transcriptional regulator [Alkalibacter mobilis]MBF7097291.1 GntR family transcriptional regulator [Alkalibacter mobilis]